MIAASGEETNKKLNNEFIDQHFVSESCHHHHHHPSPLTSSRLSFILGIQAHRT